MWRNFGSRAEMAPASRMAARLADLSHAQLVEIAAAGCDASTEVKDRADALLAAGAVGRRGSAALERPGAPPAGAAAAGGRHGGRGVLAVGGGLEGHQ